MKTLLLVVLLGLFVPYSYSATKSPHKPKESSTTQAFIKIFDDQINVTNKSIADLINLPCTTSDDIITKQYAAVKSNTYTLFGLAHDIPDDEDTVIQARQLETVYGLLYLSERWIKERAAQCASHDPNWTPDESAVPTTQTKRN